MSDGGWQVVLLVILVIVQLLITALVIRDHWTVTNGLLLYLMWKT